MHKYLAYFLWFCGKFLIIIGEYIYNIEYEPDENPINMPYIYLFILMFILRIVIEIIFNYQPKQIIKILSKNKMERNKETK